MRVFEQRPVVVGHRGVGEHLVSGVAENTLESCLAAHAEGAGWVELDARLTADDALVLHHDSHLPDGRPVDEATVAMCRDQGVATLDEVLDGLPEGMGVDLEVKTSLRDARAGAAASTGGRVARRAEELVGRRPVVVTSFDPGALLRATETAPRVPTGLLGMPITPLRELVPAATALGARVVAAHAVSLGVIEAGGLPVDSPERIREAMATTRDLGLEVLVWGAAPPHVPALVELGVAAVCVDEVLATARALAERP